MSLQVEFEPDKNWVVDGTKDVSMHEATLNMNEEDELWIFIQSQVELFLGKLVTGKARDDIGSNSDKVLWQNVDGFSGESTTETGRQQFLLKMSKSYKRLKAKGHLSGSMPLLPKALFEFEAWISKDFRLMHASEHSNFKLPDDLGKLNGADESNSLHANMLRDTNCIPGNAPCSKKCWPFI